MTEEARDKAFEKELDRLFDVSTTMTEAIKEFAERLKKKETTAIHRDRFEGVISTDDIDSLVKGMVGE